MGMLLAKEEHMEPTEREIDIVARRIRGAWETRGKTVKIVDGDTSPVWRFHAASAIAAWEEERANRPR